MVAKVSIRNIKKSLALPAVEWRDCALIFMVDFLTMEGILDL